MDPDPLGAASLPHQRGGVARRPAARLLLLLLCLWAAGCFQYRERLTIRRDATAVVETTIRLDRDLFRAAGGLSGIERRQRQQLVGTLPDGASYGPTETSEDEDLSVIEGSVEFASLDALSEMGVAQAEEGRMFEGQSLALTVDQGLLRYERTLGLGPFAGDRSTSQALHRSRARMEEWVFELAIPGLVVETNGEVQPDGSIRWEIPLAQVEGYRLEATVLPDPMRYTERVEVGLGGDAEVQTQLAMSRLVFEGAGGLAGLEQQTGELLGPLPDGARMEGPVLRWEGDTALIESRLTGLDQAGLSQMGEAQSAPGRMFAGQEIAIQPLATGYRYQRRLGLGPIAGGESATAALLALAPDDLRWTFQLVLPGHVLEHNATRREGRALVWELPVRTLVGHELHAEFGVGPGLWAFLPPALVAVFLLLGGWGWRRMRRR